VSTVRALTSQGNIFRVFRSELEEVDSDDDNNDDNDENGSTRTSQGKVDVTRGGPAGRRLVVRFGTTSSSLPVNDVDSARERDENAHAEDRRGIDPYSRTCR